MPTITIETTVAAPSVQRRVARGLTSWFVQRGVPAGHVITRLRTVDAGEYFAGPVPMSWALAGGLGDSCPFAFVSCVVSVERDRTFRAELARAVTELLQPDVPAGSVFVSISPVDQADQFRGSSPLPVGSADPKEAHLHD